MLVKIRNTQFSWFRSRIKEGGKPLLLVYHKETERVHVVEGYDVCYPTPLRTFQEVTDRATVSISNHCLDELSPIIEELCSK